MMAWVVPLLLLLAVCTAARAASLEAEFDAWAQEHGKTYGSAAERSARLQVAQPHPAFSILAGGTHSALVADQVFTNNVARIDSLNLVSR
jgi:hypothetical protein